MESNDDQILKGDQLDYLTGCYSDNDLMIYCDQYLKMKFRGHNNKTIFSDTTLNINVVPK